MREKENEREREREREKERMREIYYLLVLSRLYFYWSPGPVRTIIPVTFLNVLAEPKFS